MRDGSVEEKKNNERKLKIISGKKNEQRDHPKQKPTNIINYFIVIVQMIQNKLLQNSNQPPQ